MDDQNHWLATVRVDEQSDVDCDEAKANARFIVAACTMHDELLVALDYLLEQTVDLDFACGVEPTEGEQDARRLALAAMAKTRELAARPIARSDRRAKR